MHGRASPSISAGRTTRRRRRGVAMLLVIVSLVMATILSTAYLASRDNSTLIGQNIADAAAARWASESALELGVAMLETPTAWRTDHAGGTFFEDRPLGTARVTLEAIDLETGQPPTASTHHVRLTATATFGDVEQVATAEAYVAPPEYRDVDVDLSEFAIFGRGEVQLNDRALVSRWIEAPLSRTPRRQYVGTRSLSLSAIQVNGSATAVDTTFVVPPGTSGLLKMLLTSLGLVKDDMNDPIPVPNPPSPGVVDPSGSGATTEVDAASATFTVASDARWTRLRLGSNSRMTVQDNVRVVSDEDIRLESGTVVVVNGRVKLVAWDDFEMQNAAILLNPGARLEIFVGDQLVLDDAYIGDAASYVSSVETADTQYVHPNRVRIYSIGSTARTFVMQSDSLLKGSVYAPVANFVMQDRARLFGRIVGNQINVRHDAAVLYDPALNSGVGYVNPRSYIFEVDGDIKQQVKDVSQIPDGYLTLSGSAISPSANPAIPTARPILVEADETAVGADSDAWESAGGGG